MLHAAAAHGAGTVERIHHLLNHRIVEVAGVGEFRSHLAHGGAVTAVERGDQIHLLAGDVFRVIQRFEKEAAGAAQTAVHTGVQMGDQLAVGGVPKNIEGFFF